LLKIVSPITNMITPKFTFEIKKLVLNNQGLLFCFGLALFLILLTKFIFDFGPFVSTDIVDYSRMARDVCNGLFPHSSSFSPGYPFFIGITSRIFNIHESKSIFIWIFVLIFSTILLVYNFIRLNFKNEKFTFIKLAFISFIFLSHWAILKVLITAHADALFLALLIGYFYFLFKWLRTYNLKWFVLSTLYAGLCIWVKYNGLILLPFLIIASLIFGKNKFKFQILFLPILTAFTSYFTFKTINGSVIKHFQGTNFFDKLEFALQNLGLLYSNLVLSGRVYFGVLFTNSIQLVTPDWVAFVFFIVSLILFFWYFLFSKMNKKIENVLLYFSFFYWFSFFVLCQYTSYEEIDTRTLMPSVLSFILWIILIFKSLKKNIQYLIVFVVVLNLVYSFYFIAVLNSRTDKKNTFNYISNFSNRKSIVELKKLQNTYNFKDRIYTNEIRNVLYALDYSGVNRYPTRKLFVNGKFRELNIQEYDEIRQKFCNYFSTNTCAVLLIDCPKLKIEKCLLTKYSKIYYIENDILLVNILK
jgi:hypothetical protein